CNVRPIPSLFPGKQSLYTFMLIMTWEIINASFILLMRLTNKTVHGKVNVQTEKGKSMESIGYMSIISMLSHVVFIYLTWQAIQSVNIDYFIREGKVKEARVLMILVTVAVGTLVSNFVLDIIQWSQDLIYLF